MKTPPLACEIKPSMYFLIAKNHIYNTSGTDGRYSPVMSILKPLPYIVGVYKDGLPQYPGVVLNISHGIGEV